MSPKFGTHLKAFALGALAGVAALSIVLCALHAFLSSTQMGKTAAYIAAPEWGNVSGERYYDVLGEREQEGYAIIENAMRNHSNIAAMPVGMTFDELDNAVNSVLLDNPDLIWATPYYAFVPCGDKAVFALFWYVIDANQSRIYHDRLVAEARRFAEEARSVADPEAEGYDEELAKALLREEASRLSYDHNDYDQTGFALVALDGKTVCAGYSKIYKLLCDAAGLECYSIFGFSYGSEQSRHLWNMLRLGDGTVVYVDPTYVDDGTEKGSTGRWFCDRGLFFEESHVPGPLSAKLPIVEDGAAQTEEQNKPVEGADPQIIWDSIEELHDKYGNLYDTLSDPNGPWSFPLDEQGKQQSWRDALREYRSRDCFL